MKSLKFKLIISNILLSVVVLLLIGTTIAYFTDTKGISNTLTSGNVTITLSEAEVKSDNAGNLVEDTNAQRFFGTANSATHDYKTIFPGQSIFKDPTIQNIGDQDAWIAAKITLTDGAGHIDRVLSYPGYQGIDIKELLYGGLIGESAHVGVWNGIEQVRHNDNYAMVQIPDAATGKFEFYFFLNNKFLQGDSTVIFDHMNIPDYFSSEDMQEFKELTIDIRAYAVQARGFDNCFDAMKEAFPSHFDF